MISPRLARADTSRPSSCLAPGRKLSAMLASEGKSKPEGFFGTCKPGTTPGMIVVNTSMNISLCCFGNILGGVIYAVAPNPISSLG